jgi:ligand-binding sensor domain-containing protein/two-component sensor histidine kinase
MKFQLTLLGAFLILAGDILGQQNSFKHFRLEQGLPQSQVFSIDADEHGFLWVGTRGGGVARFDGSNFHTYSSKQGLTNTFVNVVSAEDSAVFVGTDAGLFHIKNDRVFSHQFPQNSSAKVLSLFTYNNQLLIGTTHGLFVLENNEIRLVEGLNRVNFHISSFLSTDSGVFMGSNQGLIFANQNLEIFQTWTTKDGLSENFIQDIQRLSDGRIIIATYGSGINSLSIAGKVKKSEITLPPGTILYDVLVRENTLYLATQKQGLLALSLTDGSLNQYGMKQGITNSHVRSLCLDSWQNLWVGTSGGGLNLFSGSGFGHYTKEHGLPDNYIYAVEELDSSLLIASGRRGTVQLKNSAFYKTSQDSALDGYKVKTIAKAPFGEIWCGTEGNGIARRLNDTLIWLDASKGLCGNYIKDISTNGSQVYVATLDGGFSAIQHTGKKLIINNYRYLEHLPSNRVSAVLAHKNRCYFGMESKGFGYLENGEIVLLASEDFLEYSSVRSVHADVHGNIWIATSGGLFIYSEEANKIQKIKTEDFEFRSENFYSLTFGDDGRLYLGHERGLEVVTLNESLDVIDLQFYDRKSGFEGIESCQNAAIKARDGTMWFGTINGLTSLIPNYKKSTHGKPKVWLSEVEIFYEKLQSGEYGYSGANYQQVTSPPELDYQQNHINFEFIGLELGNPNSLKFRYRLEGLEDSLGPPTSRNSISYTNLAPGKYTFQYMSLNNEGNLSELHDFTFLIKTPFWMTNTFRLLVIAASILILAFLFILVLRRAKRRSDQLRLEAEAAREKLELEQKALQLQMNPHFLFNALNSIQSLVAQGNDKQARAYLQKFAKLMRLILAGSRKKLITLTDEIDLLTYYLELEQLTKQNAFEFSIETHKGMDSDDIHIPGMMIQPFVENAIKHGIPDQKDGRIDIHFSEEEDELVCTIRDNGIGIKASKEKKDERAKKHESMALQVIQDRLKLMDAQIAPNPKIIDLKEVLNQQGTEVQIRLGIT